MEEESTRVVSPARGRRHRALPRRGPEAVAEVTAARARAVCLPMMAPAAPPGLGPRDTRIRGQGLASERMARN